MKPESTSRGRDLKASVLYLLPSVLSNALPLLALPLLTRALSTTDFGLIALAQVFGTVAFGFANLGLSSAFERNWFKYRENKQQLGSLYLSVILFLMISGSLILLLSHGLLPWIDHLLFHEVSPAGLVLFSATAAMFRGINQIGYQFLRNAEKPKSFAILSVAEGVSGFLLTLFFVVSLGKGVNGYFSAQCLAFGITTMLLSATVLRSHPGRLSIELLVESLRLGAPLTFRVLLGLLANQFDKYMIGWLAPMGQVGIYSIGQRIAQVPYIFTTALDAVFIPRVYRAMFAASGAGAKNPLDAKRIETEKAEEIGRYLLPFHFASTGIALLVCLFAEEALFLLTEKSFHGAADIIIILSVYYASLFFSKVNGRQIMFAQKTYLSSLLLAVSIILNVIFYVPLIRWAGADGAALATLIAGVLATAVTFRFAQKCFPIDWKAPKLVAQYAILVFASACLVGLRELNIPYLGHLPVKLLALGSYIWIGHQLGYFPSLRPRFLSRAGQ